MGVMVAVVAEARVPRWLTWCQALLRELWWAGSVTCTTAPRDGHSSQRHREAKVQAQGHTVCRWHCGLLGLGILADISLCHRNMSE